MAPEVTTPAEAIFTFISELFGRRQSPHITAISYHRTDKQLPWHHWIDRGEIPIYGFVVYLNVYSFMHIMVHHDEVIIAARIPQCAAMWGGEHIGYRLEGAPLIKLSKIKQHRKRQITYIVEGRARYYGGIHGMTARFPLVDPNSIEKLNFYVDRLISNAILLITTIDGKPVVRIENVRLTEPLQVVTDEYKQHRLKRKRK
jgi:hypothetical protein